MYTLIEIFDSKQYENIITPFSLQNISKIVYVGSENVMTKEKINNVKKFYTSQNNSVPVDFYYVKRDDARSVKNTLADIILSNQNCIFDATGGEDLILSVAGICACEFSVPVIRTNTDDASLSVINGNIRNLHSKTPSFGINDLICLQGGRILSSTPSSRISQQDINYIRKLFLINSINCENYILFCNIISEYIAKENEHIIISKEKAEFLDNRHKGIIHDILNLLVKYDLIEKISKGNSLKFRINRPIVASCLKKAGNLLEYYTAIAVRDTGMQLSDIRIGASIEWNNRNSFLETLNEIDVLAVYENKPVFISCKNGDVKKEALYELDAVSRALGGSYTKKILVCTYISKNRSAREHIINRAHDMDIGIIYDSHKKTYEDFIYHIKKEIS